MNRKVKLGAYDIAVLGLVARFSHIGTFFQEVEQLKGIEKII